MIKSSTLLKKYLYILINFNEFSSINYYAPLITSNILSQYPCRKDYQQQYCGFLDTTAPAPITTSSPIVTPGKIIDSIEANKTILTYTNSSL